MSTLPTLPSGDGGPKKSFWSRPEGKVGLGINIAAGLAIFYFWGLIVPFVLSAFENTIKLAILAAIVAAVGFVLFDPNFRRFVWYLYRTVMRMITGWFINIDPIGVLKTYVEKLRDKLEELQSAIGDIRGQRQRLEKSLATNIKDYEECMRKVRAADGHKNDQDPAKARNAVRVMQLESKQAVRLEELISKQQEHQRRYNYVIDVMTRYNEICGDMLVDTERDIQFRQMDREQSRGFAKAMRASLGILKGLPDDKEMYDMSIESLERDYAAKIGEVENILDLTKNVVTQADFNDSASMQKAAELLDKWQAGTGVTAKAISAPGGSITATPEQSQSIPVVNVDDDYFRNLFNR